MIDVFTRWPIAIPIPNRNATTIMEAIYKHLVCEHGLPRRILSDRGKEFIDQGLLKMCDMLGISKVTTTGYQPQANGHVERFHKYMNASMTILSNRSVEEWDWFLPAILFSYRCSPCESTSYSPYFLLHGRHPNLPADILFKLNCTEFQSESDYATRVVGALHDAFEHGVSLSGLE